MHRMLLENLYGCVTRTTRIKFCQQVQSKMISFAVDVKEIGLCK